MSIRHLTRGMPRPEEEEHEEADGAQGGVPVADDAAEDTGIMNMASLYSLLQKTLQSQDREAYKQEQRWRSVQVQLNNVRDELEGERRSGSDGRRPGNTGSSQTLVQHHLIDKSKLGRRQIRVEIGPPWHVKAQKSRRQRRREKLQGTVQRMGDQLPVPNMPREALWEIPSNISELQ
ncbi:unnamed protein product [Boreogadus saida]